MNSTTKRESATEILLGKAAMVAGFGLLIMTIFAVFAIYFVFDNLIVPGDATTTAKYILANEMQFRIGIGSYLIVIICDVVVAWALYIFLKPVNKNLSLLTAWFRLIYAIFFGIALVNYISVLQLLSDAHYLKVFETEQLHVQVMLFLNAFSDGWAIGLIFFGLHLTLLGYLVFKSGYIPKILGVLLVAAGLGYLIDNFVKFLLPNYDLNIATFVGWGELLFMLWLLLKGGKAEPSDDSTP